MTSKRNLSTKSARFGKNRSHSLKATPRRFKPNLQTVSYYIPEWGRSVRIRISAKEIRVIDKIGLAAFLQRQGRSLNDLRKL